MRVILKVRVCVVREYNGYSYGLRKETGTSGERQNE